MLMMPNVRYTVEGFRLLLWPLITLIKLLSFSITLSKSLGFDVSHSSEVK